MRKHTFEFVVIEPFLFKEEGKMPRVTAIGEIITGLKKEQEIQFVFDKLAVPKDFPEKALFEITRPCVFKTDTEIFAFKPGEIAELTKDEAIRLIIEKKARPVDKSIWGDFE